MIFSDQTIYQYFLFKFNFQKKIFYSTGVASLAKLFKFSFSFVPHTLIVPAGKDRVLIIRK